MKQDEIERGFGCLVVALLFAALWWKLGFVWAFVSYLILWIVARMSR
jgi:hypothetical protein